MKAVPGKKKPIQTKNLRAAACAYYLKYSVKELTIFRQPFDTVVHVANKILITYCVCKILLLIIHMGSCGVPI